MIVRSRSDESSTTIVAQHLKRDTAIQTGFNQPIVASGYFTTYHFQNGSYVEAVPDATPPSKPLVTDEGPLTSNSTQLAASWMSNDPESGIREYRSEERRVGKECRSRWSPDH